MIYDELVPPYGSQILELGKKLWKESRFDDEPFDEERCKTILSLTVKRPDRFFISYNVEDGQVTGFALMGIQEHYFSGTLMASDYGLYVAPEYRGSRQVIRLLDSVEDWAKQHEAKSITIYHNTGIETDKAPSLFKKLGFDMKGYIFSKEIK